MNVLKPDGSFYIAIGDDYAAYVKVIADELGLFMRNWIIWHYTFGQQAKNKFARSHTHIFYFVKDKKNFTFNDYAVRVPSDRQLIYNDRRANPIGKMPNDVWTDFSRVCGTFKERAGWHPCQMPEKLLKRIISVSSRPGNCVLDPFSGSGTTASAAKQLGRIYVGIDISETYVENARIRLAELQKARSESLFFDSSEADCLQQLLWDMDMPAEKIVRDRNLVKILTSQFNVRINNSKEYRTEEVTTALKDLMD
jgi:site-specific DNA-methyltransferase (adenine-specific)